MQLLLRSAFLLCCLILCGPLSSHAVNFTVSNLNDAGPGSIADALNGANSSPGLDSIQFSVAGTINLNGQLPAITDAVVVDGSTAPGYIPCGAPVVALNFVGGGGAHGFLILAGGAGTTIKGLNIRGFTAAAVSSEFSAQITVQSCYIGTDLTGTVPMPNNLGVFLLGSPDCVVGGDSCEGNIICASLANGVALELGSHRAIVAGNSVGLGADGITLMGNGLEGIYAYDSDSLQIGLAAPGQGNTIIGSGAQGIHLNGGGNGSPNALIYNNMVGTNGSDSTAYGNDFNGIFVEGGTSGTRIGGTDPFQANAIAHNGLNGIEIDSLNNRNLIVGNSIYCNADSGIYLYFANDLIPILPNLTSTTDSVFGSGASPGHQIHAYRNLTDGDSAFCDCEGEEYIGTGTVDAAGNWAVVHSLGLSPAEQASVTATQTDDLNNTSEFFLPCAGGVPAGLSRSPLAGKLSIAPNPGSGTFRLTTGQSLAGPQHLRIYDAYGRCVYQQHFDSLSEADVDGTLWGQGIYFIVVEGDMGALRGKWIKN